MSEPDRVPTSSEPVSVALARLARSLGVDESKVQAALQATRLTPAEAFAFILHGEHEERVAALAKELHVSRPRLALALLDGAVQTTSTWAQQNQGLGEKVGAAARSAASRAQEWALEVGEFFLEIFAETIPRILNRITLALVLMGVVLVGLGALAFIDRALFLVVAYYAMAAFLVVAGAALVWAAWRIHEATATLRTLARVARKWRARVNQWQGRDE